MSRNRVQRDADAFSGHPTEALQSCSTPPQGPAVRLPSSVPSRLLADRQPFEENPPSERHLPQVDLHLRGCAGSGRHLDTDLLRRAVDRWLGAELLLQGALCGTDDQFPPVTRPPGLNLHCFTSFCGMFLSCSPLARALRQKTLRLLDRAAFQAVSSRMCVDFRRSSAAMPGTGQEPTVRGRHPRADCRCPAPMRGAGSRSRADSPS